MLMNIIKNAALVTYVLFLQTGDFAFSPYREGSSVKFKMITSTHKLIFQLASTDKISCQTVQEIQSKKRIKELLEVLDLH